MTFPQLSDPDGRVFAYYDVLAQPAVVVIAPDGETRTRTGAVEADELDGLVRDAMA